MLTQKLTELLERLARDLGLPYPAGVTVTEPPTHVQADFSTNIAMQLARETKGNPRQLAETVQATLAKQPEVAGVDIAGPGFLNIQLRDTWYTEALGQDLSAVRHTGAPQKINIEYISANPSGPVHIGNARGGPVGETIARALEAQGHQVNREFYVNDVGGQANKFAASVLHYYLEHFGVPSEFPEKGYPAPYVKELAEEIAAREGDRLLHLPEEERLETMRALAIGAMVEGIKATSDRMGIHFDTWFWQSQLESSGLSQQVLAELKAKDATLEKEGALWLKSGIAEDDRETVLVKSDGSFGYFLDDIAYHQDKLVQRGFATAIVLLGANHSGHVPRMRAGIKALGLDPDRYQGVLYQYVQLKEGEETRRMAKREGTFVTADDVLNEVPREVFNYFMLSKANETHLDFDLQLAKDTSEKNPVYYIQYAHARICSVLTRAGVQGGELPAEYAYAPEERQLLRHLAGFDAVVAEVAATYHPHLLPTYLHELATRYHHFYAHHRILTDDTTATAVRLRLSQQAAAVIRQGLALMNIEALERMDRED